MGAESEARRSPLTYQQVLLFDKSVVQRAKRRYINEHLQQESDDNVEDDSLNQFEVVSHDKTSMQSPRYALTLNDFKVPNEEFEELFRSHLKRKKLRKKIRANPEVRFPSSLKGPYFKSLKIIACTFVLVACEKRKSTCEESFKKSKAEA